MKRRSFLSSILAAGYAPAAIASGVLMPVKKIVTPMPMAQAIASIKSAVEPVGGYVLFVHPSVATEIRALGLYRGVRIVEQGALPLRTGRLVRWP